ncbi:YT521-B-like domain-containing protein [Phycomyces blakesleeanus]|uniref:YT521-B-like domain-containing protein n=1 Tax=Phycomyces blakesleeanus TaxID=4837 RepID=A0ABR3AWT2_PHYBL
MIYYTLILVCPPLVDISKTKQNKTKNKKKQRKFMSLNIPLQSTSMSQEDPNHLEWDMVIRSDLSHNTSVDEALDASNISSHSSVISLESAQNIVSEDTTIDGARFSPNLSSVVQDMHLSTIEHDMQELAISSPTSVHIDNYNLSETSSPSESIFIYRPDTWCAQSTLSSDNTTSTTTEIKTIDQQSNVVIDNTHDRTNPKGCLDWKNVAFNIFLKTTSSQVQSQPGSRISSSTEPFTVDNKDQDCAAEEVESFSPINDYNSAIMWIGFLPKTVSFKDLQRLLYSPDVLHIKYRRIEHFAHVTYGSDEALFINIQRFDNTVFHGVILQCYPIGLESPTDHQSLPFVYPPLLCDMNNDVAELYQTPMTSIGYTEFSYCYRSGQENEYYTEYSPTATLIPYPNINPYFYVPSVPWYTPYARYFILKPWAPQDLKFSFQTGYWSVSRPKMEHLNIVFENTPKVYLIFSITGSGEYCGCAQMISPVIDILECRKYGRQYGLVNTPFKNEYKKRKRSGKNKQKAQLKSKSKEAPDEVQSKGPIEPLGQIRHPRPWNFVFALEWIVRCRIPFRKSPDFFNPWNMTLVKESVDGTELETSVGEQLIEMFKLKSNTKGKEIDVEGCFE